MSKAQACNVNVTVRRLTAAAAAARAEELAALTRAAYAGADPLPGLPVPDGARETAEKVRAALAAGAVVWVALAAEGVPVGAARVRDWEISRVSVVPAARGTGVARALLAAVEHAAVTAGVPEVRLNAVIERCLPPRYARLGYRVVSHWPSPDKPLTEVTMTRRAGGPCVARLLPWDGAALLPHRAVRSWLLRGQELICVTAPGADPVRAVRKAAIQFPDARLAGVDVCARAEVACERLPAARPDVLAHLMPRAAAPGTFALWRFAPGHEAAAASIAMEVSAR